MRIRISGLAVLLLGGCLNEIGGTLKVDSPTPEDPAHPPDQTPEPPCEPGPIEATPMLRIGRAQYDHVAADLLGTSFAPSSALAPDEKVGPFPLNSATLMTRALAEQYEFVAEQIGAEVEADPLRFAPCDDPTSKGAECAKRFIASFGRLALRRPLASLERGRWLALYRAQSTDGYGAGIRAIVEGLLQSPSFLFRFEALPQGGTAATARTWELDANRIATRLAFLLWNSGPDDALLDAAADGRLLTSEGRRSEIDRMLADPKSSRTFDAFGSAWAGLEPLDLAITSPDGQRGLSHQTLASMRSETIDFIRSVLVDDGRLSTLFTASWTPADPRLAHELYGAGPSAIDGRIHLDPTQRSGILTHASVLFAHSHQEQTSPVLRGKWIREVMFCQKVPDPPPTVNAVPPPPREGQSTRERFLEHRLDPTCASCHALLDDLGFGFEAYDPVGRFRTTDGGRAVDDRGAISSTDVNGDFRGIPELGRRLASSEMVSKCFASQWFRYGLGRDAGAGEKCSIRRLSRAATSPKGSFAGLIAALVESDSFLQRRSP